MGLEASECKYAINYLGLATWKYGCAIRYTGLQAWERKYGMNYRGLEAWECKYGNKIHVSRSLGTRVCDEMNGSGSPGAQYAIQYTDLGA